MYILALCILILFYIGVVYAMKYMKNVKVWNIVFTLVTFIAYITVVIVVYLDVGFRDWNFQNTLPVANVSPFMFASLPFSFVLPKKIRKYYFLLVSLLIVGMFFSAVFNCVYNTVISYKFHFHFLLDYIAHVVLSLWGVYLVKTKQVELTKKDITITFIVMLSIITLMLILNVIFDTSFFGLSLNGKHNIYNNVIVESSYLSALIYYIGVVVVLFMGLGAQKLLNLKKSE